MKCGRQSHGKKQSQCKGTFKMANNAEHFLIQGPQSEPKMNLNLVAYAEVHAAMQSMMTIQNTAARE